MFLPILGPALSRCGPLRCPRVSCPSGRVNLSRQALNHGGSQVPAQGGRVSLDGEVYRLKTNWEILRALLLYGICSSPRMVKNASKILHWSQKFLGRRIFKRTLKATAYGQFVAGETQAQVVESAARLRRLGVQTMVAVPLEEDVGEGQRESWFDNNLQSELASVDLAKNCGPRPMMQLKVTSLMGADLCASVSRTLTLPLASGFFSPHCLLQAMDGQHARGRGVPLLIDAEMTYLNPCISLIAMTLMLSFNQSQPFIWNTYQCYLKDVERLLSEDLACASRLGLCFGVKLVRGAYMDRERERAEQCGYPDPIQKSWEDTNHSYLKLLDRMLGEVRKEGTRVGLVVATQNEASVQHTLERMEELEIARDSGAVHFAQLLGMADHISLALGTAGYSVYKSLPFGGVDEVIPYLVRRAQENHTALRGLRREGQLLRGELRRRFLLWTSRHF
ncbi:hydroxyproline dehydrogenase isoform X2 [Narcine bancroftii]|uniref:hydroxyproline dehydrogenase isoform X2 n=1 Tax=Narcine bancroftii TaxID=1343680 RepID=UPI0038321498